MKKCLWLSALMAVGFVLCSCGGGGGGSDDEGLASTPSGSSGSNTVSAGFVAVQGGTVTGGSKFTLAGQTADYYKGVFVAGRTVTLSSFYICDHEVTQAEYQAVMGSNPSSFSSNPADGETQGNRPVKCVTWYDAIIYCNKRSISEGLTPCYSISGKTNPNEWKFCNGIDDDSDGLVDEADDDLDGDGDITCIFSENGYRLPTEAEWEFAARGGESGCSAANPTDYAGTDNSASLGNYAWYSSNSDSKTHEVMKKTRNSLGLYDMSGNVWEWCWDGYDTIATGSVTNPTGGSSGSGRVGRGGSWGSDADYCSVAFRLQRLPLQLYWLPRGSLRSVTPLAKKKYESSARERAAAATGGTFVKGNARKRVFFLRVIPNATNVDSGSVEDCIFTYTDPETSSG